MTNRNRPYATAIALVSALKTAVVSIVRVVSGSLTTINPITGFYGAAKNNRLSLGN